MLPPEPFAWPFDGDEYRMAMGLRSQEVAQWLAPDAGWSAQMAERTRLLRHQKWDVMALMPEARDPATELYHLLHNHLTKCFPDWFTGLADGITSRVTGDSLRLPDFDHPLHLLGHLLPDDLCLLTPSPGGWRLTGGVVCFPSHWYLPHKLGKPLPGIHRPVPGYDTRLATSVDRFFDRAAPGRTAWRVNWSLSDDPGLYQPGLSASKPPPTFATVSDAGAGLYLRVERQTLTRLPDSGAMLFTIRTHIRPLSALTQGQTRQFAAVLRSVPTDIAAYKGLTRTAVPALAFLDSVGS